MTVQLVIHSGPEAGKTFLLDGEEFVIGRENGNSVFIQNSEISRRHAVIKNSQGTYSIQDLDSKNGTFINGVKIRKPRNLQPGDKISLGDQVVLLFEIEGFDPNETATSLRRKDLRSDRSPVATRERKQPTSTGVNIDGDDVEIGADIVGGNKVVKVSNYFQNPTKPRRRITVARIKKRLGGLAKNRVTWVVLVLFIALAGGIYRIQSQPLVVCHPKDGTYVVLVSKFEAVGVAERDVSRFIVDDLNQSLTVQPPPTNFTVCEYPKVIHTDKDALSIALINHADVIIWGNFTSQYVESNIQVGESLRVLIPKDVLARTTNVRVQMSDERQDSISKQVLWLITVVEVARGNPYEASRNLVKYFSIDSTNSRIISEGVSGHVYRSIDLFLQDTSQALKEANTAIDLDAGNPLLYVYRAIGFQRIGHFDESSDDLESATRLGPPSWTPPLAYKASSEMFAGNNVAAIQNFSQVIAIGPDHWYLYNMRGYLWLATGDFGKAKADIDKSLALGPAENWPYMWATSIALRQGRLADAKQYIQDGLTRFPDPDAGEKVAELFSGEGANSFTPSLSAFWSMNLRQFNRAIQMAQLVQTINPKITDAYLVEGISNCNLGKLPEAEAAYTKAIEIEPTFALLYMLRADVRVQQGNLPDAMADFNLLQQSPQATQMADYILAAQTGKLSCKNFLTYTP